MTIWPTAPALCLQAANSDKQPTKKEADTGVVHSKRLAGGVPLGGLGCGTFELMTDGSISRATINNNWDHPIGELPGCFAAIWTNAGGRKLVRSLKLKSEYHLPTIGALDYRGLFPQAFITYPDRDLPISLSLRAYSPLIPQDLKNSALPVALFAFTLKNEAHAPVEAAIAFSWEDLIGVGGSSAQGVLSDRTGNTVRMLPSAEGLFGLRMDGPGQPVNAPTDRLRYNATGNYALLVRPDSPDAQVSIAGWNALDSTPGWWTRFASDGVVEGTVATGREGSIHPSGVVALKVSLKDRETQQVVFAVAWYTPRLYVISGQEYGHLYEKSFDDSAAVARYALLDRLSLAALTDEWQSRLLRSNLPPWLARKLINDASTLFSNTILTRDSGLPAPHPGPSLFSILESPQEGHGALGAMDHRWIASALYAAWYPTLEEQELRQFKALQAPSGALPRLDGDLDQMIGTPPPEDTPESQTVESGGRTNALPITTDPDTVCGYVFQVYRDFLWSGNQHFLDEFYPSAKHAVQFIAAQPNVAGGIPAGPTIYGRDIGVYHATLWLAALQIGRKMADVMHDRPFAAECASAFDRAQKATLTTLWNGSILREQPQTTTPTSSSEPELLFTDQLAGQWMADMVEAGDLLPTDILNRILDRIATISSASPFGIPFEVGPDGKAAEGLCWPTHDAAFCAALFTLRGHADAGLALMQKLDTMVREQIGLPWQIPLRYPVDTGLAVNGRQHLTGPSSWLYLYALEGFALDLSQQRMTLSPHLPLGLGALSAPIFAPGFWAWLEYRPGPTRTRLTFQLDRTLPVGNSASWANAPSTHSRSFLAPPGLIFQQIVLTDAGYASPGVTASLGRAPAPGKFVRTAPGRLVFTFDTPVQLAAGDRLEFTLRENASGTTGR